MVADQVDTFLKDLDQRLRQQGLTLQDYMKITQKTNDALYNDYRENAEQTVRRSLALREIAEAEKLSVTETQINEQIEKILEQFGEDQRDTIRQIFTRQAHMRDSVRSDLLRDTVLDRILVIAKGEAPAISEVAAEVTETQPPQPQEEATSEKSEESE